MPFEVPTESFNATAWAANKALRLNQREASILQNFIADYESFWDVSGSDKTETIDGEQVTTFVGGGCIHTTDEMQAIIDALGTAVFMAIATAASKMIAYIEDNGGTVPDRYKSPAFDYTIGLGGIVLTGLASVWAVPEKNEE